MTLGKFISVLSVLCLVSPALANDLPRPLTAEDFHAADAEQARIGRLLFHDKLLSGNRNIACSTCHSVDHGSGDGVSLGIGQGGMGVGPDRLATVGEFRIRKRIPRNAPPLWNLAAKDITTLFHDGRLQVSDAYASGYASPAGEALPEGLPTPLAAQALFPMTAQFEMAGDPQENEVATMAGDGLDRAWPLIAARVAAQPHYAQMFRAAFDSVEEPADITIVEIATALAAYMTVDFTSFDSPFDAFLAGDEAALTPLQHEGMDLFYGRARCSTCHAGPLMTDESFHALGLPQFGPGKDETEGAAPRDVGRMALSQSEADAYRFRTPMLRNVALTAPYGHNGAYSTLRGILRHHANPQRSLVQWTIAEAQLPDAPWLADIDTAILADAEETARLLETIDIEPIALSDHDLDALEAFLIALTGESARQPSLGRPGAVPSGLVVE